MFIKVSPPGSEKSSYKACSAIEPTAQWLHDILTLRHLAISKLDLSATPYLKLSGRDLGHVLEPLMNGAQVRELVLSGSPLQFVGAATVVKLLSHPRCPLEKLSMSNCYFCTREPVFVCLWFGLGVFAFAFCCSCRMARCCMCARLFVGP